MAISCSSHSDPNTPPIPTRQLNTESPRTHRAHHRVVRADQSFPRRPSVMHPYTANPGASGLSSIYMRGALQSKALARNVNTRNKGCSVDGCCTFVTDCALFEGREAIGGVGIYSPRSHEGHEGPAGRYDELQPRLIQHRVTEDTENITLGVIPAKAGIRFT